MARIRKRKYHKGQWAVHCERAGLPLDARPTAGFSPSTAIQDVIPDLMKTFGLESRFWEEELINEWPALVGPVNLRHTRPGRVDSKVLHVFVTNSVLLSELSRFGKRELLIKIQKRFGRDKIRDIRFQMDPDRRPGRN